LSMKRIKKLISTEDKGGKMLYTYLIDDTATKPYKVSAVDREFEIGERVQVIWTDNSDKYGEGYLKRICDKCNLAYKEKDAVLHEFCNITYRGDLV
jgi:hypothetical protein